MAQKRIRVAYEFECSQAEILDFDHHQMLKDIAKSFNKAGLTVQPRVSSVSVDIETSYGPPRWAGAADPKLFTDVYDVAAERIRRGRSKTISSDEVLRHAEPDTPGPE